MSTSTEKLQERLNRYPSESRLTLMRNLAYGSAAACLVVLAELIQLGPTIRVELEIAATAAGLAIPPWIALGTLYEFYIILGAKSYPHLRGTFSKKLISLIAIVGGFSMLVMVGAVLYFLALNALVYFAISVLLSLMALVIFQSHLAKWWNVNAKDEA